MNCFYCQTEIVDGHCVNRCAEKRQIEQGHIDQEYQRSILSSDRNSRTSASIMLACILAFILAFIAYLIIEYVRGCDQAPSTPVGMTILGTFVKGGVESRNATAGVGDYSNPQASLANTYGDDLRQNRPAPTGESKKSSSRSSARPFHDSFSNPRSTSSAHPTVAVGPANGLAGPFCLTN